MPLAMVGCIPWQIAVDYQGTARYLLEGIVDCRLHKKFGWQYKVKWVGYPVSEKEDEDWRQRKDFVNKALVDMYNETHPDGPKPDDPRDHFKAPKKRAAPSALPIAGTANKRGRQSAPAARTTTPVNRRQSKRKRSTNKSTSDG